MKLIVIVAALLASCGPGETCHQETALSTSEVWVCHNPQSELHGKACVEETNVIRGPHQPCFWANHKRVKSSYCWLLEKADCEGSQEYAWQQENCHFFDGALK